MSKIRTFYISEAIITSASSGVRTDITDSIQRLDIYENLDMPYVTGYIEFVENTRFLDLNSMLGVDTIDIVISDAIEDNFQVLQKRFVIDRIMALGKNPSSGANVIIVHIMEFHGFIDQHKSVNEPLTGTRYDMISQLSQYLNCSTLDNLQKPLITQNYSEGYVDAPRKYIVPQNTTPLTASQNLCNYDFDVEGYPYFLYGALNNTNLVYISLKTILEQPSPYPILSNDKTTTSEKGEFRISEWSSDITHDYMKINSRGLWNTNLRIHDPVSQKNKSIEYKMGEFYQSISKGNVIENLEVDKLDDVLSSTKTVIVPQTTFGQNFVAIQNSPNIEYKYAMLSELLKSVLRENAIQIKIPEASYFLPQKTRNLRNRVESAIGEMWSQTLGKKLDLNFYASNSDPHQHDQTMGGSYFIYSSKFCFVKEGDDFNSSVTFVCTRLNYSNTVGYRQ